MAKQTKMKNLIATETYRLGADWDLTDQRQGVYKVYDDNSCELTCSECGEVYELSGDHKFALIVAQDNETAKHATCASCYRLKKEKKAQKKDTYSGRAGVGQAINLYVLPGGKRPSDFGTPDEIAEAVVDWLTITEQIQQENNG